MRKCLLCDAAMREGTHKNRKYCDECTGNRARERGRVKRGSCSSCGKPVHKTRAKGGWTPPAEHVCRECRRVDAPSASAVRQCVGCTTVFGVDRPSNPKRYCSRACANRHTATTRSSRLPEGGLVRRPTEARKMLEARRADRDKLAPGPYTPMNRRRLLAQWKKQRKSCIYCNNAPVETVDHILPLALGGTNYEGNLAPACHDCNRAKLDNLLSAWRYGIRVHRWRVPVEPRLPKARPRRAKVVDGKQIVMQICDTCGWVGGHPVSSYDCFRTKMRNKYRDKVGIPREAPLHTRAS